MGGLKHSDQSVFKKDYQVKEKPRAESIVAPPDTTSLVKDVKQVLNSKPTLQYANSISIDRLPSKQRENSLVVKERSEDTSFANDASVASNTPNRQTEE